MNQASHTPVAVDKINAYIQLTRANKPIGWLLLLWPTLWALWLAADGLVSPKLFFIFVAGVWLMRAAGCVINDIADRNIDGKVTRTQNRPLATGAITVRDALFLFITLIVCAFVLVLMTDLKTIQLSFVGAGLAVLYPFMKRMTWMPQLVLGAAFAWSIPMAFSAQAGNMPPLCWLLYTATLVWVLMYDTLYAMVDRDDDIKIGVRSTAILFGTMDRPIIAILQLTFIGMMALVGSRAELSAPYYWSMLVVALLFAYQHWLIRNRSRAGCFDAFLNNNWVGVAIFVGLLWHYYGNAVQQWFQSFL